MKNDFRTEDLHRALDYARIHLLEGYAVSIHAKQINYWKTLYYITVSKAVMDE